MNLWRSNALIACIFLSLIVGCAQSGKKDREARKLEESIVLNNVIGSYGEVFSVKDTPIAGVGLVMGLHGTGSSECPTHVKEYLITFIQKELNTSNRTEAINLIESDDTAVVRILGTLPEGSYKGQRFDVAVEALPNTQTTSLEDGILYPCELFETSRLGVEGANKLATANGPIFIDKLSKTNIDKRKAIVIGGGNVTTSSQLAFSLYKPNYILSNLIRNRINQRFGDKTAQAKSSNIIMLNTPSQYYNQYKKFSSLVQLLYLPENEAAERDRIMILAQELNDDSKALKSELALEAVGKTAIASVSGFLNSQNEKVRLRAARLMNNLNDKRAIRPLRNIAADTSSRYRVEAIKAIGSGQRNIALETLPAFLSDRNTDVKIAAYEELLKLRDFSINRTNIANSFFLDTVSTSGSKIIYANRSITPKIVVFGRNISLNQNIFIKTNDGITINAPAGSPYVTLVKIIPGKSQIIGPLKCSYSFDDFIKTLCNSPADKARPGLGVNYSNALDIIQKMIANKSIAANLIISPLPRP